MSVSLHASLPRSAELAVADVPSGASSASGAPSFPASPAAEHAASCSKMSTIGNWVILNMSRFLSVGSEMLESDSIAGPGRDEAVLRDRDEQARRAEKRYIERLLLDE